jgi:transposase-like protein
MKGIPDFKAKTILPFLQQNVSPGSTIYTDGLKSFDGLTEAGFKHIARTQPLRSELRRGAKSAVSLVESRYWKSPAMGDRHLVRVEQAAKSASPSAYRPAENAA